MLWRGNLYTSESARKFQQFYNSQIIATKIIHMHDWSCTQEVRMNLKLQNRITKVDRGIMGESELWVQVGFEQFVDA